MANLKIANMCVKFFVSLAIYAFARAEVVENIAPTMGEGCPEAFALSLILEDEPSEPTEVSYLLSLSSAMDVDDDALGGIAITQTTGGGGGTWQYQPSDEPS